MVIELLHGEYFTTGLFLKVQIVASLFYLTNLINVNYEGLKENLVGSFTKIVVNNLKI